MKNYIYAFVLMFQSTLFAQVNDWNTYVDTLGIRITEEGEEEIDFIMADLYINFTKEELQRKKTLEILKRRISRVYPYVQATAENLVILNRNLETMKTNSQKRAYIKRAEKYLNGQFKEKLKKMSRKDGQILVKLINRQTNKTTFELVKEFKSGWSAFWSNQTAKLFDINLKTKYNPYETLEDFYIEYLLMEFEKTGRIPYKKPEMPINRSQVLESWKTKLGDSGLYPQ